MTTLTLHQSDFIKEASTVHFKSIKNNDLGS